MGSHKLSTARMPKINNTFDVMRSSMVLSSNIDCPIVAVLVHVSDVQAGLDWYQLAFPTAIRSYVTEFNFEFLDIGGIQLEIVPSDEKVAAGACGSVVYWAVPDLEIALLHMQSIGAKLYRGPLKIEAGQYMCQVLDPWGNCIGLRSFSNSSEALTWDIS
jgi:predicted enzyme related to lactoylglutathione lyase